MNQTKFQSTLVKLFGLVAIFALILIDQGTKHLATLYLKNQAAVPIIDNVFYLYYLENKGAAFGILQGQKIFFLLLTVCITLAACYIYYRLPATKHFFLLRLTVILLISGAIGNFIDRVMQTYVVDFLYFSPIDFPVFNFADICVTFAEIFLVIDILFVYRNDDFKEVFARHGNHRNDSGNA